MPRKKPTTPRADNLEKAMRFLPISGPTATVVNAVKMDIAALQAQIDELKPKK